MTELEVKVEAQALMIRQYQQWLADKQLLLAEALAKNGLQSQRIVQLEEELTKPAP